MKKYSLNRSWTIKANGGEFVSDVPCSILSVLLENKAIDDPYWGDNEEKTLDIVDNDFEFSRTVEISSDQLESDKLLLKCDGLDTICYLYLNDIEIGYADNMHRTWEFDIKKVAKVGSNDLRIEFKSPVKYIRSAVEKDFIGGSNLAMKGFPHLRKAHHMFGWDWGPRLPDSGIWRDISIVSINDSRIKDIIIKQFHDGNDVSIEVDVKQEGEAEIAVELICPNGNIQAIVPGEMSKIEDAKLWWPNGYGKQPLYTVKVSLYKDNQVIDLQEKRIGLRTVTVSTEEDQYGNEFAHVVNGIKIFAMGSDYIPEDIIFNRITREKTYKLLKACADSNFNCIRVWGGGYYVDSYFYNICDELGLLVWQDFMFACANYHLTPEFEANIIAEFRDNIRRLRHHASLAIWCGNNEIEMFQAIFHYKGTLTTQRDYIRIFEHIIPQVLKEEQSDTYYWPSSPSSAGSFDEPNSENRGDVHCWDVWHANKPIEYYRECMIRYCSEYGLPALPATKTIEAFTLPEDRTVTSRVMEMHQRGGAVNNKLLKYLLQYYSYPFNFESLRYASQILQAEAVKCGAEHWRRHRGRCMGAIYWQLNDIYPAISWASIDYYGRWKALQYYAKRFFAPVMISCHEVGETTGRPNITSEKFEIETSAHLCVSNETLNEHKGVVSWSLRTPDSEVIEEGEFKLTIPPLTSSWCEKLIFKDIDFLRCYLSFEWIEDKEIISQGSVLFTAPKHFKFVDPKLSYTIKDDTIVLSSLAYAKSIEIVADADEYLLEDNYFDMNKGEKAIKVLQGDINKITVRSLYDIR